MAEKARYYGKVITGGNTMDRIERSKMKFKERFGDVQSAMPEPDPELQDIMVRFIFGDVLCEGELDDKTRESLTCPQKGYHLLS